MPNLDLTLKTDVSSFRKIAIGTWADAYDPSVYGTMEVNMDEAMRYLADFRARTGRKLTISHMMAKVAAMARARLMGMGGQPARVMSDEEKKRIREKRKKERQNKKKNRRR